MAYTPAPTPPAYQRQSRPATTVRPTAAPPPAPNGGSLWNTAWNVGYNSANQTSNPYAGQTVGGYDIGSGFIQGQQAYMNDMQSRNRVLPPPQSETVNTSSGGGSILGANTVFAQAVPSAEVSPEMEAAINDYYKPAFERLNLLQQGYEQQYPTTQQQVENSYNEALQPINERLASGTNLIDQQRVKAQEGKDSAISQARQLYNELLQQGLNKFGGASSTGGAYASIIGNQIAKNMGGIEKTSMDTNAQLDSETKNLNDFVSKQKIDLGNKKQAALDQVKNDFDQKIREINMQRNTLESDKAAQRIDALKEARQRAYAVEDANAAYQRQIDAFHEQTRATLASQYSVNGGISEKALAIFTQLINSGIPSMTAAKLTGIDTTKLQGIVSPTNAWKQDDINGGYVNLVTGETRASLSNNILDQLGQQNPNQSTQPTNQGLFPVPNLNYYQGS